MISYNRPIKKKNKRKKTFISEIRRNKQFRIMVILTLLYIISLIVVSIEVRKFDVDDKDYEIYSEIDNSSKITIIPLQNGTNYIGKVYLYSNSDSLKVKVYIDIDGEVISNETIIRDYSSELVRFTYNAKSDVVLTINIELYGDSYNQIIIEKEKDDLYKINILLGDIIIGLVIMLILTPMLAIFLYLKEEFPTEIPFGLPFETKNDKKKIVSEFYVLFDKYIMKDVPNYHSMKSIQKLDVRIRKCNEYFWYLNKNGVEFTVERGTILEPGSGIKFNPISDKKINQDYIQLKTLAHLIIEMNKHTVEKNIYLVYILILSFGITFSLWSISDLFVFLPFIVIFFLFIRLKRGVKESNTCLDARASIDSATITREELNWLAQSLSQVGL